MQASRSDAPCSESGNHPVDEIVGTANEEFILCAGAHSTQIFHLHLATLIEILPFAIRRPWMAVPCLERSVLEVRAQRVQLPFQRECRASDRAVKELERVKRSSDRKFFCDSCNGRLSDACRYEYQGIDERLRQVKAAGGPGGLHLVSV